MICNFIIYRKSLNIPASKRQLFVSFLISVPVATLATIFNQIFPGLDFCVTFILSPLIFKLMYKNNWNITIFVSIFAIAISFFFNIIAIALTIPIALTLGASMNYNYSFDVISYCIIGFISILLSYGLFRIKRFKYGFTFLSNKYFSDISIVLSSGIIFIYTFFRFGQIRSIHNLILVFAFILVISLFLYITIKKQLTQHYISRITERRINSLENELDLLQKKISSLECHNDKLNSIIHKDNKLIPAMELAVKEVLISYTPTKAEQLLEQLNTLTNERKGIITNYEYSNISIAHIQNIRINSIINYMYRKGLEQNIDFKFTCFGDISKMVVDIVSEEDICTLIADLVENALIATNLVSNKHLLLSIEALPENYSICVYDSAEFFSKEVIKRLGKKRYTTHKDTGGIGIGLMTTFELIKKYNASFSINEQIDKAPYTKCVSIVFDNNHSITYNGINIK